ncbi:hypothetical protein QN224_31590 [Sinorhizobium sp. 8-89]|uniref:hypothetical protein n=1 Tax=Sinorhizobium sp. 7-81 TaxID=3049087 RepID=UPI0024C35D4E|nr:hypothetical protein [Sinorhizobium sp. 7-81]MDK1389882.1 hypothetical protein [Sinorhizobium sp. 7-81]
MRNVRRLEPDAEGAKRPAQVPLEGMPDDLTWNLAMVWKPRGARRALIAFLETIRSISPTK